MKYIWYVSKSFVSFQLFKDFVSLHIKFHEMENFIDMNNQELKTFSLPNVLMTTSIQKV